MNKLYRHPTDKVVGGVAAGLGVWMNVDPTIVRIVWVLLAFFTGGVFLVIYIVMLFVVPLPPQPWTPGPGPGSGPPQGSPPPGGWQAWQSTPAPDPAPGAGVPPVPGGAPGSWQPVPPPSGGWTRPSVVNGNAGIVGGVILVLLGAWFLVDQYIDIDWTLLWPVLVMLAGVALIVLAVRRGRQRG